MALGQALFFDKVLSGNKNIACATCHHPSAFSGDGLPLSLGEGASGQTTARIRSADDQVIPRHAPALFHVGARNVRSMFWDSRVTRDGGGVLQTPVAALNGATPARPDITAQLTSALAAQPMFPVTSSEEMRGDPGENELADAANELKAIRERVVALEKRLRDEPSPEAVAELQKEVESLTRVLTELAERPPTTSAQPWPRDLNSQPADASWGSDPEDLRGG